MFERDDHLVAGALRPPPGRGAILGVVFAGGASRRFGHDKASAELGGVSLLHRVANCIQPQVDTLAISGKSRSQLTVPTIPDELAGDGPLAALCSVLRLASREGWPFVTTVSCDTPFLPDNFVNRLSTALRDHDCALASWGGVLHPTCALWATTACAKIELAIKSGERSLRHAIARLDAVEVDFSGVAYGPGGDPFFNINTQLDMAAAQAWLSESNTPA